MTSIGNIIGSLFLAAGAVLATGTPAFARAAEIVVSTAEERTAVDVTVYNRDLALIREARTIDLPRGRLTLEFQDVPARIRPATLLVDGGGGFALLEQNYEFDLMSRERILEKYVGRELAWIQDDGSRVTGTLLGMSAGPVFRVGDEVVFDVPGRLALPRLPDNLRARPTLVWLADAERGGRHTLEASYLTSGLSWSADYVLQLDAEGARAGLQAWVTVENRSGASYDEARLLLVAGDVNQVRDMMNRRVTEMADVAYAAAPAFTEEALYDYHLYTLQRPAALLDNQIKQVSLFEAEDIAVERRYRVGGRTAFFRGAGPLRDDSPVEVRYLLANESDNRLGVPLPAGVVRVYGASGGGGRQLLGEDRIGHTPAGETVELTVGRAFDLVAERVRTDSRRLADNLYRHSFRVTLRNHKPEDVSIEVVEPVGGDWQVTEASHEPRKVDAATVAFDVPVAAGGESVLSYTVEVRY